MTSRNQKNTNAGQNTSGTSGFTGFLIGGLLGAGAMLLLAPRSGRETREEIQRKSVELRERALGGVRDTVSEVRSRARQLGGEARGKVEDFQDKARDAAAEQLDRISRSAEAGRKALRKSE